MHVSNWSWFWPLGSTDNPICQFQVQGKQCFYNHPSPFHSNTVQLMQLRSKNTTEMAEVTKNIDSRLCKKKKHVLKNRTSNENLHAGIHCSYSATWYIFLQ